MAGSDRVANPALDRVRQECAARLGLVDESARRFLIVTDFPMFDRDPDTGALGAVHHPFTAPNPDDMAAYPDEPHRWRALAYDVVLNGLELGGGSIRTHDVAACSRACSRCSASATPRNRSAASASCSRGFARRRAAARRHRVRRSTASRCCSPGATSLRDVIAFPKTTTARALFEGRADAGDAGRDARAAPPAGGHVMAEGTMTGAGGGESVTTRLSTEGADLLLLAGVATRTCSELQRIFPVRVTLRGDAMAIAGAADVVQRALPVAQRMIDAARQRAPLEPDDVLRMSLENGRDTGSGDRIVLPGVRKIIQPKTSGQAAYLQAIADNDIVVGIGPAGTGKTYLAVAAAVDALARKRVRRIVLARPAVEAGESLGFLPGDMQAKVDPYLRPLYDALEDMMPPERAAGARDPGDRDRAAGVHARPHARGRLRDPRRGAERHERCR